MDIYTVAFFGHRYIDNIMETEDMLYEYIKDLILKKCYVDFLVGNNGDFDRCVSSVIRRVKNEICADNSSHILFMPYITVEYVKNKDSYDAFYDEIEIYDFASTVHPKIAFALRNQEMADRADEIVCYIKKKNGGAYKAVKYAKSKGKKTINLYNKSEGR